MEETKEIEALMQLIDDPDEIVYSTVSDKIISFGRAILPNLEHLWENTGNEFTQERIEFLIHRVHLRELEMDFKKWMDEDGSLIDGALLVARYHYPDLDQSFTLKEISKLSKNIWLELNNYLTPVEKINVFHGIFYHYYKISGLEISYTNPEAFLINKALETKKGNAFANGILHLILCSQLDLPVYAVKIPRQFLLAWFSEPHTYFDDRSDPQRISFYINPSNGELYSQQDIDSYINKLQAPHAAEYFEPLSPKGIIKYLLEELSKCFDDEKNAYKRDELLAFANMLGE